MTENTGHRLAKNTLFMYFRMILLMIISFYTSRVVLRELGVDDYGIYNVVGSVIVMFNSLRTIFSSSTQRFLNYEMGKMNKNNLLVIFNLSIYVNFLIAFVFVIFCEAIGYWFLEYKINLDPSRLFAAKCVFQFSVLSAVLSIMTTTYDAEIIAHEKMNVFAYLSILEAILRLLIVFALSIITGYDKLIVYGVLVLSVTILMRLINVIYCILSFEECKYRIVWDSSYFKKMTTFAGWNFLGNTSYALSQSGLNMILNIFGGPAVNTARGLAYQVNQTCHNVVTNLVVVVRPAYIKKYAQGIENNANQILYLSAKVTFIAQFCVLIPILILTEPLLQFWLGNIPKYSVIFLQLIMIDSQIRSLSPSLDMYFQAVGNLKYYQMTECFLLLIPLLFAYALLYFGFPYYSVFIGLIVVEIINFSCTLYVAKRTAYFDIKSYWNNVLVPCYLFFGFFIIIYLLFDNMNFAMLYSCFYVLFSYIVLGIYWYFWGFSEGEISNIKSIIKRHR